MTDSTVVTYICGTKSITFAPDSNFWLSDIAGLATDVDITTSHSASNLGDTVSSQCIKSKKITFTGDLHGDLLTARAQMLACILPGEYAKIIFSDNGRELYVEGYPTRTPEIEIGGAIQGFQFEFLAPYPYFKSTETKSYILAGINPLWQTPFMFQTETWISRFTENSFTTIINSGNVAQAFEIEVYAAEGVTNPKVYNITTNSFISINKTMMRGERFLISTHDKDKDTGNALIYKKSDGIIESGFKFISPESDLDMKIVPGENIFMVNADENKTNLQCIIVTAGGEYHSI